jgi:SOS-response transcriptional repressors (recA-mediated autopeptidases)|nr:MAG TPA: Repressor protein CI [Caudoviricetes sp.]
MGTFADRLKTLLINADMRPIDLSNITKIDKSSISRYLKGDYIPKQRKLTKIAQALNANEGWLLTGVEQKGPELSIDLPPGAHRPQFKKVPMLGYAAAGQSLEDINQDTPYYDVDNKYDVDFCITIRGDSMINAGINDGDIVFIKSVPEVPNGKIACVEIDNERVCLKRFYKSADGIMLVSENPKYTPIQLNRFNCQSVKILGLAVLRQSEIQ